MENKNLVNGNTVLAPKHKPYYPDRDKEYEKLKKAKEEERKALIEKRLEKKKQTMKLIVLALVTGIILILRYSAVYKLQKSLTNIKTEMHNITMENENLKVELIKASNMEQVEKVAKSKLNMITPDKKNVIYLETTKDYFAKDTKETEKNVQEDLIAKIKNMLF
ncbi:cell division protein FtsL [Clostridium caldaquaticum]|uniref:cell division protein FtsL n=1 Tax=Clostridium caldaquaticum TaxID=2940653 RepID=UPI00207732C7|nr:cell division protein FtsL [Clostridium caldaquaticum]